jgi:phage-related protein
MAKILSGPIKLIYGLGDGIRSFVLAFKGIKGLAGGFGFFTSLKAGAMAAIGPVGLVVLALAAIAGAAYLIWRNWDTISAWFKENVIPWYEEYIKPTFDKIAEIVEKVLGWIGDWWEQNGATVIAELTEMARIVKDYLVAAFQLWWKAMKIALLPTIIAVIAIVKALQWVWENAGEQIMSYVMAIWDIFSTYFMFVWNMLKEFLSFLTNIFTGQWGEAWENVKNMAGLAMEFLQAIPEMLWNLLYSALSIVGEVISEIAQAFWSWTSGARDSLMSGITDMWNSVYESVAGFISNLIDNISGAVDASIDWIKEAIPGAIKNFVEFSDNVWAWIGEFVSDLPGKFMEGLDALIGIGESVIDFILQGLEGGLSGIWEWGGNLLRAIRDGVIDKAPGFMQGTLRNIFGGSDQSKKTIDDFAPSQAAIAAGRRTGNVVVEGGVTQSLIPRRANAGMSLMVRIGDRDITDIVDARVLEDNLDVAHALFVRRK